MLVHSKCSGQVFVHGSFIYCDLCEGVVKLEDTMIVDTPRPSKDWSVKKKPLGFV
jgi:hypothetical protein